jgi:hypothetical protein
MQKSVAVGCLLTCLAFLTPVAAWSQGAGWDCSGADSPEHCRQTGGSSDSQGYGGGLIGQFLWLFVPHDAAPAQRTETAREVQASAANNRGLRAWTAGDYSTAAAYFRDALRYTPNDPTIRDNLAQSEAKIAVQQAVKQRQADMSASLERAAAAITATQKPLQTSGLDFVGPSSSGRVPAPASQTSASSLDFIPTAAATISGGSRVFGSTNPANPDLSMPTAPPVGVNSALEQLSSAAKSSGAAKNSSVGEASKSEAGCAIGDDACRAPDKTQYPMASARTQGTMELISQVPQAIRGDQQINDNIAYYDQLEKRKIARQAQISDVQQQIAKGGGDSGLLKAKMATLDNANKQDAADQAAVVVQMKKRVLDLGRTWEEGGQKAGTAGGDSARATHQP